MSQQLARSSSPEERELEKKRAELAAIEDVLARQELDLATLAAELSAFENEYLRVVGIKYAELDAIEADIAERLARRNPTDTEAQEQAAEAQATAEDSAQAAGEAVAESRSAGFSPSEDIKKLYRRAAMAIHPDLASNDADRQHRGLIMAEINQAYACGDEERLQAILRDWQDSPESVEGEGPGVKLVRIIRMIARVEDRLRTIKTEMDELRGSELSDLKAEVGRARTDGRDLLAEMAEELDQRIRDAQGRLRALHDDTKDNV